MQPAEQAAEAPEAREVAVTEEAAQASIPDVPLMSIRLKIIWAAPA